MKGLAVKRVLALMMLWALLFCGCTSTRYSGRYGDGTVYRGIGEEKTFRKFYIRKIEGEGAFVSAVSMSQKHPALFTRSPRPGDIPVDVYVKKIKSDDGGGWTFVFAALYSIIPSWTWNTQTYSVEIFVDGNDKSLPVASCEFEHIFKMSILSPLGLIPFGEKDGFQRNEFNSGLMAMSLDISTVLEEVMADCIAQQLTKHAIERLSIPDIDFASGEKE